MIHLMEGKSNNFINFFFLKERKPGGLENAPKVTCLNCKDQVPLTSWEDHDKSCCGGTSKQADSEYEVCDGGIRVKKLQ